MFKTKKNILRIILILSFLILPVVGVILINYQLNKEEDITPEESSASVPNKPERWFHPNYHYDFKHDLASEKWGNYFKEKSFEEDVVKNIDVMGFFILQINRNEGNFVSNVMPILERNNVKVAVEGMALNPLDLKPNGQMGAIDCKSPDRAKNSAQSEIRMLKKIYDAGGKVDYLSLDDPIARGMKGSYYDDGVWYAKSCGGTMDESIDMLVTYIKEVNKAYPDIKIGIITNFPNWEYNGTPAYTNDLKFGDYKIAVDKLMIKLNADPAKPKVHFIHADNPYDYAKGIQPTTKKNVDWMKRIVDLENQTEKYGLEFGLIYNSHRGGGDFSSGNDELYYNDTLSYIQEYKNYGGSPANILVESWYKHPLTLLPSEEKYSMSYTALEGFRLAYELYGANDSSKSLSVYRLSYQGAFIYTISEKEKKEKVNSGYTLDGIAFKARNGKANNDLKPVYKLSHTNPNGFVYIMNEKEKTDAIKIYGWKDEGIAFYAYEKSGTNRVPVYRLQNKSNTAIFLFTTSTIEKDQAIKTYGYSYNGVVFYVE